MKIHHIAIVVNSIDKTIDWYSDIYNAKKIDSIFVYEKQGVKIQFLEINNTKIELLEPLNDKSPISSFLREKGSGNIYHIAFEVKDLDKTKNEVRNQGGIVISRTKNGWNGMEVMFAVFIKNKEKQIVEYVKKK